MRTGAVALLLIGMFAVGCSHPAAEDLPPTVKNEKPLPGGDQRMSDQAAKMKAMGEEMNRAHSQNR